MKTRFVLPAALFAAALSLAACAPDATINPDATGAPTAAPTVAASTAKVDPAEALAAMKWIDNGAETAPGLEFDFPTDFTEAGSLVVTEGDGAAVEPNQMLGLSYVVYSAADASVLYSTYEAGTPEKIQLLEGQLEPVLYSALEAGSVGSQILFAVPDSGSGAVIMAITISTAEDVLERAEGTAVAPVAGLPVVTLDADGKPTVTYDGATKSTTLVAQDLITGAGAVVEEGQDITIHYTGWVYEGEQFDSSWDRGTPATYPFATGQLIDGWIQGLVGKTVGSQVLLVIPPELGYGADGNGDAIPGDATLVFVVDILAVN